MKVEGLSFRASIVIDALTNRHRQLGF